MIIFSRDVNPILNCVVDSRFDEALAEAKQLDEKLQKMSKEEKETLFKQKPYLGIPFTIKDCFPAQGLSWTAGLYYRKSVKADHDAPVVAAMKEAGCILLGVTNVSELCMWMESYNTVYGRTNNPYHTNRTVGGSSGGEGCVVASADSPWGVGSDVGGSIRMPAFFNGIYGHKPSTGIVDNLGGLPHAYGVIDTYLVTGPMCRFAEDLEPMLRILASASGRTTINRLDLDKPVNVTKVRFFFMPDDGGFPLITSVHPELQRAQNSFLKMFKDNYNVEVIKANLPNLYHSLPIWTESMSSEPKSNSFSAELVQV